MTITTQNGKTLCFPSLYMDSDLCTSLCFLLYIPGCRAMFTLWAPRSLPLWTLSSSQSWRRSWGKRFRGCWSRCRRRSRRYNKPCWLFLTAIMLYRQLWKGVWNNQRSLLNYLVVMVTRKRGMHFMKYNRYKCLVVLLASHKQPFVKNLVVLYRSLTCLKRA